MHITKLEGTGIVQDTLLETICTNVPLYYLTERRCYSFSLRTIPSSTESGKAPIEDAQGRQARIMGVPLPVK